MALYAILFYIISFSSDGYSQLGKAIIANTDRNEQLVYPEVRGEQGFNTTEMKAPSGCWNFLNASYDNISDSMYGLPGTYAFYNPADDGSFGAIQLGWTFTFYGQTYDSLFINVNGKSIVIVNCVDQFKQMKHINTNHNF